MEAAVTLNRGFDGHRPRGLDRIFAKQAGAERDQALQAGQDLFHFDLKLPQIVDFSANHDFAQKQGVVIFNRYRGICR